MGVLKAVITIAGRACLAAIFLLSAVTNKIPNYSEVIGTMTNVGVPVPSIALPVAIVFLILGSISLILGYKARIGATLLLVFTAAATCYFHAFWLVPPEQFEAQLIHFLKNLGLVGGLLLIPLCFSPAT